MRKNGGEAALEAWCVRGTLRAGRWIRKGPEDGYSMAEWLGMGPCFPHSQAGIVVGGLVIWKLGQVPCFCEPRTWTRMPDWN